MRARVLATIAVAALALSSLPAAAQAESNTPQGRPVAKAKAAAAAVAGAAAGTPAGSGAPETAQPAAAPAGSSPILEEVKRQEEIAATDKGLTYDPAGRRDPFISPAEAIKLEDIGQCEGEGVECWLISEVEIVGVLSRRSGAVALVIGADGYGASLKPGDKLYDGEVQSVDPGTGTVVFRQKVNDPTRIKPYRDIEKKLNTSREGGV